jgi:hypothetical protein
MVRHRHQSLQVTATKRLTTGLGFLAAYTFSKAIGYVDGNGPGANYSRAPPKITITAASSVL